MIPALKLTGDTLKNAYDRRAQIYDKTVAKAEWPYQKRN